MTIRTPVDDHTGDAVEGPQSAVDAGRQLAAATAVPSGARVGDPVEVMARAGLQRLRQLGVDAEVVRSRRHCLVVRSTSRNSNGAASACALVGSWLQALPSIAHGSAGTVAESTCAARGGHVCMHTLMWRVPDPMPPSPVSHPRAPLPPVSHPPAPPGAMPFAAPPPPTATPPTATLPTATLPTSSSPGAPLAAPLEHHPAQPEPTAHDLVPAVSGSEPERRRPASARWAWVRRRAWLVVVGLLAGTLGGVFAGTHGATSYSATTVLVVQSGGSTIATASANGAEELAITYAALIPDDQALVARIGVEVGTTPAAAAGRLSVEAQSGTALIDVRFSGPTAGSAVAGANDVARALTSASPPGRAIVAGSVAVVSSARAASKSGSLHKYGLPLGILLGLVVGSGAALVAERADRRVDDLDALGDAAGCSATVAPGGITDSELVRALRRAGEEAVTVVPVRQGQAGAAGRLARSLTAAWGPRAHVRSGEAPTVTSSVPFDVAPEALSGGSGATVMVVGAGERMGAVREVAERLRLLGRDPAWAVLVRAGETAFAGDSGR